MTLKKVLHAGLDALPECRTIAYVDMPSGLVLASASLTPVRQEALDKLAVAAATLLESPALAGMGCGAPGGARPVAMIGRGKACLFLRALSFPEHALCYMCDETALGADLHDRIARHRDAVAAAI